MISKEQCAKIIYRNNTKSQYTFKEHIRHLDVQCGTNVHNAYRADIQVYQLGRRYISTVITKDTSYIYGPFTTANAAEYCALTEHEYKGPSNEEILYYLPYGFRTVEMVDKMLFHLSNITQLGYVSIYMHHHSNEFIYISHCGYLENRNSLLVACIETNRIYTEAHARVAVYKALQHENHRNLEGLDSVGIDSLMYE